MANIIELAKTYVPLLDEVYKNESLTAVLDGDNTLVRQGANAGELIIPKMDMSGLGEYSRSSGYVDGDVSLTNETVQCNFDRGRRFTVDSMDDMETAGIAFGRLSGEFIRTKVVPELDAFRFAAYCKAVGSSGCTAETLTTGPEVIAAIRRLTTKMDEAEVPANDRYLFITPTLLGLVQDMETNKSREVLDNFAAVIKVPQGRFYTAIKQLTGKDGESKGGYAKAEGAADINLMAVHKGALIQFEKHAAPKIITPDNNPNSDGYLFGYRLLTIAEVYENKLAGIEVSHKPAV